MRRWKKTVLAFGLSLALAGGVEAMDPYYLNGDKAYPMIQNTGGIYNDGGTGLFMDLSTVKVEDVFEDGLACQATAFLLDKRKEQGRAVMHLRFSENGKAWAETANGTWLEIPEQADDPASMAVYFIRQALGDDTLRESLTSQIEAIAAAKKDNLGRVEPEEAIPLSAQQPATPEAGVKEKGSVQQEESPQPDVVVTITEAPKVEITPTPPAQVEITQE